MDQEKVSVVEADRPRGVMAGLIWRGQQGQTIQDLEVCWIGKGLEQIGFLNDDSDCCYGIVCGSRMEVGGTDL